MERCFRNIFVPIDFSGPSLEAARFAARFADTQNASICLFHAQVLHTENHEARLEALAAELRETHPKLELSAKVERSFEAAETLLDAARSEEADLILLGSRARGRATEFFLGGITRKILRHSEASVLVVHEEGPALEGGALCLTLALDLSDESPALLQEADQLARNLEARLDVVHVLEPEHPAAAAALPELEANPHRPRTAQALTRIGSLLDDAVEGERPEGCTVSARCLLGDPTKALREHLEATTPDLLLLGTHGRTGVRRILLGSVAEQLTTETPLPVLVLKPHAPPTAA
ncbi:MAG: universal stress protein [Acidobacteriota bacterium]